MSVVADICAGRRRALRVVGVALLLQAAWLVAAPPASADGPPAGCEYHSNQSGTVNRYPLSNTVGFAYCTAQVNGTTAYFHQTAWCSGSIDPFLQVFIEFDSCTLQMITGDGSPYMELRALFSYNVKIGWETFTIGKVGCMEHWRLLPRTIPEHLPDSGCPA